jgi:hypothetical protein
MIRLENQVAGGEQDSLDPGVLANFLPSGHTMTRRCSPGTEGRCSICFPSNVTQLIPMRVHVLASELTGPFPFESCHLGDLLA